ncbi:MAG: hypothetical protein DI535_05590 [Citrobacter freundii]|nr:MAG: hypothetical protein DI535_05590 [Citrobacter freundii]
MPRIKLLIIKGLLILLLQPYSLLAISQGYDGDEPIILTGKITGLKPGKAGKTDLEIGFPRGTGIASANISIDSNGNFKDSIFGPEGMYLLIDGNSFPYSQYFKPGGRYSIRYKAAGPQLGEVQLNGDDTAVNRYFIKKHQEKTFFDPSEKITEAAFRKILANWKNTESGRVEKYPLSATLAASEKKAIEYERLFNLFLFTRFSEMRDTSYKRSAITDQEFSIDYSDVADYKIYSSYSSLVYEYYLKRLDSIESVRLKEDSSFNLRQVRTRLLAQIISDQYIRNDILSKVVIYDLKEVKDIEAYYKDFTTFYTGEDELLKAEALDVYLRLTKLKRGTPSPKFNNYESFNGGKQSLDDYLGKFVFIDIWATWCGNCWGEFSYIRTIEEKFKNKNIVFLSISQDEDHNLWKKTVTKEKLPGIQLLAPNRNDGFFQEYAVYGIPRYILLDPFGKIISYSTPRPSEQELMLLFESVGL